jgi:hypothetical protein
MNRIKINGRELRYYPFPLEGNHVGWCPRPCDDEEVEILVGGERVTAVYKAYDRGAGSWLVDGEPVEPEGMWG